jgi:multidrug efflux pump subunit AcrA (membrane-fusion protein)
METDLSNRVNKILSARKIQKQRIESNVLGQAMQQEKIEKEQKPVVQALEQQLAQLQQLEQAQQAIAPLLQQQGQLQQEQLQQLQQLQHLKEPQEAARIISDKGQMIQDMFATYRRGKESRLSTNEINQQGEIGEHGRIDWANLLNEGRVLLKVGKYTVKTIEPDDMTLGLAALLTLPARDIEKSGITVTDEDKREYYNVMSLAGFKPSSSVKYRILKEWKDLVPEEEEEEFYPASTTVQASSLSAPVSPERRTRRTVATKTKPKTGKGLFVYKTPGELQEQLALMVGSIRAGNTSSALRNDMRAILDEMLEINYIDPGLHEKFYNKFRLL